MTLDLGKLTWRVLTREPFALCNVTAFGNLYATLCGSYGLPHVATDGRHPSQANTPAVRKGMQL
jgi:hypothetical protein